MVGSLRVLWVMFSWRFGKEDMVVLKPHGGREDEGAPRLRRALYHEGGVSYRLQPEVGARFGR